MKHLYCLLFLTCFAFTSSEKKVSVRINEFSVLEGKWEGELTYLDYSSGKPYTMPANCEVKLYKKVQQIHVASIYPNEMEANAVDTIQLSKKGTYMNTEKLIAKTTNASGELILLTEENGTDGNDNQPARFHHTYTISKNKFSIRKDVQFSGTTTWVKRHEYLYSRKP